MTTLTYTDRYVTKEFSDLWECLQWEQDRQETCSHGYTEYREVTTKRGTYCAIRCMQCHVVVKSWKE